MGTQTRKPRAKKRITEMDALEMHYNSTYSEIIRILSMVLKEEKNEFQNFCIDENEMEEINYFFEKTRILPSEHISTKNFFELLKLIELEEFTRAQMMELCLNVIKFIDKLAYIGNVTFDELLRIAPEPYKTIIKETGLSNLTSEQTTALKEYMIQLKNKNSLPEHLKINSSLPGKIAREVIPYARKKQRFNDVVVSMDGYGVFTAIYNKKNGNRVELKLNSLNDIPILLKKDIKFNKFWDFLLYCLTVNGYYNGGYLIIPYKEWLEYTGRSTSERMVKKARAEFKEFWDILKNVEISFKGKDKKEFNSIPFNTCDTKTYKEYAEYSIEQKFIEGIGTDFYTLPTKAGRLEQANAYDIVNFIHWYAKVNVKNEKQAFNMKYKELYAHTSLPDYETVKNSDRHYDTRMFFPFDKYIQEIREKLSDYMEIEYTAPNSWEEAQRINLQITLYGINYTSIQKQREQHKEKTQQQRKNRNARMKQNERISRIETHLNIIKAE